MQCKKFEQRLHDVLDRRDDPQSDASLTEHAERCPECREVLGGTQRMLAVVAARPLPGLSDGFTERVLAEVVVQPPRRASRTLLVAACAVAAMLLIALIPVAGHWLRSPQEPAVAEQPGEQIPPSEAVAAVPVQAPGTPTASRPWMTPAEGFDFSPETAVQRLGTAAVQLPSVVTLLSSEPGEDPSAPTWIDPIAGGIRPVATSMSGAFRAIRNTWPSPRSQEAEKPQAIWRDPAADARLA